MSPENPEVMQSSYTLLDATLNCYDTLTRVLCEQVSGYIQLGGINFDRACLHNKIELTMSVEYKLRDLGDLLQILLLYYARRLVK